MPYSKKIFLIIVLAFSFSKNGDAQRVNDTLKISHMLGLELKYINTNEYGQDGMTIRPKAKIPVYGLFYTLFLPRKKKKNSLIALNANLGYSYGTIFWEDSHSSSTQRYYGDYKIVRGGIGVARFKKRLKNRSLHTGFGFDLQSPIYFIDEVNYFSQGIDHWSTVYVNKKESVRKITRLLNVVWKVDVFKTMTISMNKKGKPNAAVIGSRFAITGHEFTGGYQVISPKTLIAMIYFAYKF